MKLANAFDLSELMWSEIHRTLDWFLLAVGRCSRGDAVMATAARFAASGGSSSPPTTARATTPPAQAQATQLIVLPASLHQVILLTSAPYCVPPCSCIDYSVGSDSDDSILHSYYVIIASPTSN